MDMLVLGGTAWLGHAIAETAVTRGHQVTCAARGSSPPPARTTFVTVDRDHDDGLAPVAGRHWDAVVDVARQPGHVRRAVRDLDTDHWVLVSTGNVYADFSTLEQDESAAVREALPGDVLHDMSLYGEAKVACEDAVRAGATSATIIRSGLIGGPGDTSGRSGYWPWRFAHPTGGDVIVPDDPGFPCAVIDVRDLASWIVTAAEQRLDATCNVAGPTVPLAEVLRAAAEVAGSTAELRPVPTARLAELELTAWMGPASLPMWIDDPDVRGFATMDTRRARAAGLHTRPLDETLSDALAYEEERSQPRLAGLSDEDERRVRAALVGHPTGPPAS